MTIIVNQLHYILLQVYIEGTCDDTTQPWFYCQLNQTTQDDIEA